MKKTIWLAAVAFILLACAGCAAQPNAVPGVPAGLCVSALDENTAFVSWDPVDGADSYEVQYYSSSAGTWADDSGYRSDTSYVSDRWADVLTGLYRVRAVNRSGISGWATADPLLEDDGAKEIMVPEGEQKTAANANAGLSGFPAVPVNLQAVEADVNQALVSWDAVDGADGYEVQYYSRQYDEWKDDPDYNSGTSFISTGMSTYDWYQFRVRAVSAEGYSDWAFVTFEKRTKAPLQPQDLRAEKYSNSSAMLTWNASTGANHYDVQYYSRASDAWKSDTSYSSGTSYVSTGMTSYDWYEFRVRAVNDAGESAWTYVKYYATYSAPSAPTGFRAEPYGYNTVELSWNGIEHISYYQIQYYSYVSEKWSDDTTYTSFPDTSYVSGVNFELYDSYNFRIRAVNDFGSSSWVTATYTKPSGPAMPTALSAQQIDTSEFIFSWNGSGGASSYQVQYWSVSKNKWVDDSSYTGGTSYASSGWSYYDDYTIRVRALNNYGGASDWAELTFYVDHGLTAVPEEVYEDYLDEEEFYGLEKPIIYLYPETVTDVRVSLGHPEQLTVSYPLYADSWQVTAYPDGTLTDTAGREYYALYYEADTELPSDMSTGFVVAREDLASFLEEKLRSIGLTDREAEEMIVYWLPRMQTSPYTFIRFAEEELIESNMPLDIEPAPDSVLRVCMQWKGLEAPIHVEEQQLESFERKGFVVVEWGGSIIN